MKKFVLLHYGFVSPTEEIGKAWMKWFKEIGPHIVDSGNPFGYGREITKNGKMKELKVKEEGLEAITGYTIINAENWTKAEKLAKTCPSISGIRIYEADSM